MRLRIAILICFSLLFVGCAAVPIMQPSTSYLCHLYRRIPYETEGDYRVIDIFYATSREIKGKADLARSFKPRLGTGVSYGSVNVKIDPRLTIGKMLPHWYKRSGIIGLQKIRPTKREIFMKELKDAVGASPHKSLLVLVQGYKDNFEYTAIKASYFAYLLDVNTPVLIFDWPGDQSVSIGGYMKARKMARDSGPYLGKLLAEIEREIKPGKLWVEASSLGGQVVCNAFEYMYKHEDLADPETEIDHVILSAPDVAEKEFDDQFRKEITALSGKLTTYVSSDDEALLLSGIIDGKKKLGRQNIRIKDCEQLDEAKGMLYLKSLDPDRIAVVDVTPINSASYKHGYYLEAPEYFDDFYLRIFGKHPHVNRRLYLLKYKGEADYWILRKY